MASLVKMKDRFDIAFANDSEQIGTALLRARWA